MKALKIYFVLIATLLAIVFSSCEEKEILPVPDPEEPEKELILELPASKPEIIVKPGIPASEFQSVFDEVTKQGYRLVFIDGFLHTEGNSTQTVTKNYFNLIFEDNTEGIGWYAYVGLTGSSYQDKFDELTGEGYRLIHIESYPRANGGIRYAPIFAKVGGPAWSAFHHIKAENYQAKFNDMVDKGYRLVNRSIVKSGDKSYVTALFDKKDVGSWVAKSGLDVSETQSMMEDNADKNRQLNFLDVAQTTTTKFTFGPIFNSEPHKGWYALNMLTMDQLMNEIASAESNGYTTDIVVGYDEAVLTNGNEAYQLRFAASWTK